MTFEVPEELYYRETHEWLATHGGTRRVGITDFAQDELGDVVFVELPAVGTDLTANETFGSVESIKTVSELYAPASGRVTAVNDDLIDQPELVNMDPFGDGWMIEVELAGEIELDGLSSPDEYRLETE